ncbi:unnamed protein product [Angiostrongylus costaricensis]|uniref:ATP synthase subunit e, mitochondrial n=1 Tax=Angiostrongylus costaricensis TaxID=334426 RepID=A0A0R3PRE4_ANGCS|nr:unnamed protein product [Angiostrongylus costaricensis]
MVTSKISRFRPHFLSAGLCGAAALVLYGTFRTARMIKNWSNMEPRSQHQEMEDFLAYKERQASLKAMQEK